MTERRAVDAVAHVDGACEPVNPGGTGGWGFVIRDAHGLVLRSGFGALPAKPDMTNNCAEYVAAGMAVKAYNELARLGPLVVCSDSKLVVMQMKGAWGVRQGAYVRVYYRLRELLSTCRFKVEWEWVPREKNEEADALSKRALLEAGVEVRDREVRSGMEETQ